MKDRYLCRILEMAGNLAGILRRTILVETPWRRRRRSTRLTSEGSWSCETGTKRERRCWYRCEGEEAERKDGCKTKDKPNRKQSDSRKANLHGYMLKAKAIEVRTTKGGRHRRNRSRECVADGIEKPVRWQNDGKTWNGVPPTATGNAKLAVRSCRNGSLLVNADSSEICRPWKK